ncbi:cytochrome c3 family protein [Tautonia plasticadhaerens]|uniref:Class III cytochrome C domain-containing protein n=1 Tax=Tautonia plasticadhaerens TaxID=2527974 RepID=A0A518H8F5_9BACT|nr:cytochrome c3 family protein [Tautonia plasticadhaerens]QDV37130.1 hypothetical protein ElP_50630 [Tautonia plasticadhaerens]
MPDASTPRGPSPRRPSGKQRAVRVPLDYYKSRDPLGRWRLLLVVFAPIVSLGWWFGDQLHRGSRSEIRASHGPVWAGHAIWEHDCESCHVPFEPIKSDAAFAPRGSSRLSGSDRRCSTCHAGPIHHANQLPGKTESCGGCHRDHRGREVDLTRVPDSQCTLCHSDLPHAIAGNPPAVPRDSPSVTRFDLDHPDFAIRAASTDGLGAVVGRLSDEGPPVLDPSNLKFNHAIHLEAGIDCGFTFADLGSEDRPWFGWTTSTPIEAKVTLDCASCHLLDAGDRPAGPASAVSPGPPRTTGDYYAPISYEAHCRACHPLTIGVPDAGDVPIDVPHGMQPSELRIVLERTFAAEALDHRPSRRDRTIGGTGAESPGRSDRQTLELLRDLRSYEEARIPGARVSRPTVGDEIQENVEDAEGTLYLGKQTCSECHSYEAPRGPDPSGWTVAPTRIPEIWFSHARFSHSAHRAVSCDQCHNGVTRSSTSDDVLMPPISTCRSCHAPPDDLHGTPLRGGARFDCVECHRYHNGESPLQGIGALARQVDLPGRRTVEEFLRGSAGRSASGGPRDDPGADRGGTTRPK